MEIMYTLHAQDSVKERKILKAWVEETVKYPDFTQRFGNKYHVIRKLNGKTLKVVYVKERYIKVITSYFLK